MPPPASAVTVAPGIAVDRRGERLGAGGRCATAVLARSGGRDLLRPQHATARRADREGDRRRAVVDRDAVARRRLVHDDLLDRRRRGGRQHEESSSQRGREHESLHRALPGDPPEMPGTRPIVAQEATKCHPFEPYISYLHAHRHRARSGESPRLPPRGAEEARPDRRRRPRAGHARRGHRERGGSAPRACSSSGATSGAPSRRSPR